MVARGKHGTGHFALQEKRRAYPRTFRSDSLAGVAERSDALGQLGQAEVPDLAEERLHRPLPSIRDIEGHLGREFGKVDPEGRYAALLKFARLIANPEARVGAAAERALDYMGLTPRTPLNQVQIDRVFIGSCTNGRIEDLRAVAAIARGRKVSGHVNAMVVPGSGLVKKQAEEEGIDRILVEAGFEWREPGCSMCLAMNADKLEPGERCASTSNRNFEGRQGRGGRTHLVSPAMAAAAAITGTLADVRELAS